MTDTDIDTLPELTEQDAKARLPWESIDPNEQPIQKAGPFASTALIAVEGEKGGSADRSTSATLLRGVVAVDDDDTLTQLSADEQEEWHADRAFFSDRAISLETTSEKSSRIETSKLRATDSTSTRIAEQAATLEALNDSSNADERGIADAHAVADSSDEILPVMAELGWAEGGSTQSFTQQATELQALSDASHADDEVTGQAVFTADDASGALATALGGPGLGEGRIAESHNLITSPFHETLSEITAARFDLDTVESAQSEQPLSPNDFDQASALTAADHGLEVIADSTHDDASPGEVPPADIANAVWMTTDESTAGTSHGLQDAAALAEPSANVDADDVELGESDLAPAIVSRELPADAVTETTAGFSTTDSLVAAAAELSTLSESFVADEEVEHFGEEAILVHDTSGDVDGGYAVTAPQLEIQPQFGVASATAVEPLLTEMSPATPSNGGWTIPLMCLGLGLIACCIVIPQGEANRRLRYEQVSLVADLAQVQKQSEVNEEFLKKVAGDPTLAERLAGRQMKTIRKGERMIDLKGGVAGSEDMSPFSLVNVARPATLPPYQPRRGTIANLCNDARSRLFLLGSSLAMVAVGLVMGVGGNRRIR